ncbi:MauE/DoxX family redox-associated membrane protein [Actinophytocola sp. NPDC049390]|uniref:MauE/DoxX family redox-associated membrane protein n=1 Tax=Actinophytocola sp. NPDC049390 TaxID=3363894 RepID=UPI0037B4D6AE
MFPVSVAAYVVLFVLVIAVAERVRAPRALPAALAAHRTVPRRAIRPVAVAVTVAEAALALLVLAGPSWLGLMAAAVLFACYGGYAWYVTESGRGGPCGCGGADVPMGHWVTGRAFALAALAVVAGVAGDDVLPLTRFDERLLLVLLAAATIGTLLWHLPAAMTRHPEVVR